MPLQIIGAGFGRIGTFSLCTALNQLGFPCYHMFEISEKFPHAASSPYSKESKTPLDFWNDVANGEAGTQYDWEQIFSRYAAAVDFPTCCVWRELMSAYPDAKVILTVHPRGGTTWYESPVSTIYFSETMWQWKVLQLAPPFGRKGGTCEDRFTADPLSTQTQPPGRICLPGDSHFSECLPERRVYPH